MKNIIESILFTEIVGLVFSVNSYAQQKWDGVWSYGSRHASATLKIKMISKTKLKFEIEAFSGANDGALTGTATVKGSKAFFVDSGKEKTNCRITFTHTGKIIKIKADDCEEYGGNGVYFYGDYEKGPRKKSTETLVDYGVFPTVELDKKFVGLVGKDYEAFLNAYQVSGEMDNEDSFSAKAFSGCVRGICPYNSMIVMYDEKGSIWAAFIAAGDDESTITYYTNSNDWADKFPKTIESWVTNLRDSNKNLKIIYKNRN
jgi:hypothetical protein